MTNDSRLAALRQDQFLEVIDRDTALARFFAAITREPKAKEELPLLEAVGRTLAEDVVADLDVTAFDRSNVDGFAVIADDTYGVDEERPVALTLNEEILSPGMEPKLEVLPGTATPIATGGMVPRGANAVLMVEYTDVREDDNTLEVRRAVSPGERIAHAGLDVSRGETVLRRGQPVTAREIGVLSALGRTEVTIWKKPRVAIISTGDEVVPPGTPLPAGCVYDSNAAILAASVLELGGEPVTLGIVRDDLDQLRRALKQGLDCDVVLLSGGTSKGAGDLSYRAVEELKSPGILAHGVALKPGKPICLAVEQGVPVVILSGFPTSAIFTFHEFVAPVIRSLAGQQVKPRKSVAARVPIRINSERGRTEFLLVGLVEAESGLVAYPMGKGSGSVTNFSQADGFITIDQHTEQLDAGSAVEVQLLGDGLEPADLVVIGSHCVGLDRILSRVAQQGFTIKVMHVGSMGGLAAAKRGECDLAGIHLLDEKTGEYNTPFLSDGLSLQKGYQRQQGLVFRKDDSRFAGKSLEEALRDALADTACLMINRNAGSGTRILIDQALGESRPPGYSIQAKSHHAVAVAIEQSRADWGVAIDTVADMYGLGFIPIREEEYDFAIPDTRRERPAVQAFLKLLEEPEVREELSAMGFACG